MDALTGGPGQGGHFPQWDAPHEATWLILDSTGRHRLLDTADDGIRSQQADPPTRGWGESCLGDHRGGQNISELDEAVSDA